MRAIFPSFLIVLAFNSISFSQHSRTFRLSEFSHLKTQKIHDLTFIASETNRLEVRGKEKCIKLLRRSEQGSTLYLYFDNDERSSIQYIRLKCSPKFELYHKGFESLDVDRGFNFKGHLQARSSLFKLTSRTSGSLDLNVSVDSIDVTLLGSVGVKITGKGKYQNVTIEGSGRYEAISYLTKWARVDAQKAATAWVYVSDTLEVFSEGASRVFYYGNPEKIQKDIKEPSVLKKME